MVVCETCGSDDVEVRAWVKPNKKNEYVEEIGDCDDSYCVDCGETDRNLVDKDEWDKKNRCDDCKERKLDDYEECTCDNCSNCSDKLSDCDCDRCDDCEHLTDNCTCRPISDDNIAEIVKQAKKLKDKANNLMGTTVSVKTSGVPVISSTPGLITYGCLNCNQDFEVATHTTMCSNCLSDNIYVK